MRGGEPIERVGRASSSIHGCYGRDLAESGCSPIEQLAESIDVRDKQSFHDSLASTSAVKLGRKPRTALMELLQEKFEIADSSVHMLCLTGMPVVGKALTSLFFMDYKVPSHISVKELLNLSRRHRTSMLNRVVRVAESSGQGSPPPYGKRP